MMTALLAAAETAAAQELPCKDHLQLWLRADAGVERDGFRVLTWRDQSGNGNDASTSAGYAPVWIENAMGEKPAVRFDGARTFLEVPHAPGLDAHEGLTVLCVYRFSDGFRLLQKKSDHGGLSVDAWFLSPGAGLGAAGTYSRNQFFAPNPPTLQTSVFDPSSRAIRILNDGQLIHTVSDVPACKPNTDPLHIGKRSNPGGTEGHLKGDVAELLIYSRSLPDPDRRKIEEYLRAKYRIVRPVKPTLAVTRIIPGHHCVSVDWVRPEASVDPPDMEYRIDVKLRTASWHDAVSRTVPGSTTTGTVGGLLDHADYTVRVRALQVGTDKQIGLSAERLVRPGVVPGAVIDYLHKDDLFYVQDGRYVGSPSIAKLPDGSLVTSHDIFGRGASDFSRVFRSEDDGATWRHAADLHRAFWGKLFVHREKLYLLACSKRFGDLVLHHSPDGGTTWTEPAAIAAGTYHKAPMPVIEHGGRVWTCFELYTGGWPTGFQAVAASIPADADPMDPAKWTVSAPLPYDRSWLPKGLTIPKKNDGLLEGNAVVDPQGNLLNILRYHVAPHFRKALVLSIAPDGKSLSFNRVIDFYGGMTKFTIRRHPKTGVYWSLVNRVTDPKLCSMRNMLTLVKSEDLDHWTLVRDVLRDDNETAPRYVGFQYVDWLFDGNDILVASRTAFNGAHSFHDANHLTFHRVKDFASGSQMVGP